MKTDTEISVETYRGHDLLVLNAAAKWPLKLGLNKAELIISNVDAIQAFIEEQREKLGEDSQ